MFGWSEWFGLHEGNKIEKGAMYSNNEYMAPDVHLLVHRRSGSLVGFRAVNRHDKRHEERFHFIICNLQLVAIAPCEPLLTDGSDDFPVLVPLRNPCPTNLPALPYPPRQSSNALSKRRIPS